MPGDYQLVTDMDCVHQPDKKKILPTIGHLYIFNKCVAFYAPKLRPLIVLEYSQVSSIKKSDSLGAKIKGKITLIMTEGDKRVSFKRLKNRDKAYDSIKSLWQDARA